MKSSSAIVQSVFHIADHYYGKPFSNEAAAYAQKYVSLLNVLKRACVSGNRRKIRATKALLFRSYSSKLTCLILSMKRSISIEALKEFASTINPAYDCGEVVRAWGAEKSSGFGWRPICSFGPQRRALQRLSYDIIAAQFPPDKTDYLTKGRGAEQASDRIVNMHSEVGTTYFVVADISNFFRSVQVGKIGKLIDLPEAVVQNSLLINQTPHLSIIGDLPPETTVKQLTGAVRQGLPQGSRASQSIAALILGRVLSDISDAKLAIMYGDDVLLGAVTKIGACASKTALRAVLENHPAGPFHLKRLELVSPSEGFDFLQYRHRHDYIDNTIRRRPRAAAFKKHLWRVRQTYRSFAEELAETKFEAKRLAWLKFYRRWQFNENSDTLLWQSELVAKDEGRADRVKIKKYLYAKSTIK